MEITKRDIRLILWINGFGACTVQQIAVFLRTDVSVATRRVRKLIDAGLLQRLAVPFLTSFPIIPTSAACELAGDALPPLSGVRVGTWRHDSMLIDLEHAFERYFGGFLEPDRRIRINRKLNDQPLTAHTPDALIQRPRLRPIAIELELSKKTPTRLRQIIDGYAVNTDCERVVYVTDKENIATYIQRFTRDLDFVEVKIYRASAQRIPAPKSNSNNYKQRDVS